MKFVKHASIGNIKKKIKKIEKDDKNPDKYNKMDIQELTRSFWLEYENVFPKLSKTASIILNSSPSCSTIERFF